MAYETRKLLCLSKNLILQNDTKPKCFFTSIKTLIFEIFFLFITFMIGLVVTFKTFVNSKYRVYLIKSFTFDYRK